MPHIKKNIYIYIYIYIYNRTLLDTHGGIHMESTSRWSTLQWSIFPISFISLSRPSLSFT